jgi:succinate dehydrogenase / fumarate reductase cytochrome b subunit
MTYKKNRSLSPHLFIYKPQVTSVISIFHRVSGSVLAIALLCSSFYIDFVNFIVSFNLGFFIYICFFLILNMLFFIFLTTIIFHFTNGIRHLIWDFCIGLDLNNILVTACLVLVITFVLSSIILVL